MKPFSDNSDTSYEYVIVNKQLERFVYDAGDEIKSRDCIPTYTHAFKKASHYYDLECARFFRDEYMKMGMENLSIVRIILEDVVDDEQSP